MNHREESPWRDSKGRFSMAPMCALSMGCLCAGHSMGDATDMPCDTREDRPDLVDNDA